MYNNSKINFEIFEQLILKVTLIVISIIVFLCNVFLNKNVDTYYFFNIFLGLLMLIFYYYFIKRNYTGIFGKNNYSFFIYIFIFLFSFCGLLISMLLMFLFMLIIIKKDSKKELNKTKFLSKNTVYFILGIVFIIWYILFVNVFIFPHFNFNCDESFIQSCDVYNSLLYIYPIIFVYFVFCLWVHNKNFTFKFIVYPVMSFVFLLISILNLSIYSSYLVVFSFLVLSFLVFSMVVLFFVGMIFDLRL